jgi:hypothetical protein
MLLREEGLHPDDLAWDDPRRARVIRIVRDFRATIRVLRKGVPTSCKEGSSNDTTSSATPVDTYFALKRTSRLNRQTRLAGVRL